MRRYLPRRWIDRTVRPARRCTSLGTGHRRRGSRTATPEITRPASCGSSPRRVTSTSGSSGMWKTSLCGAPNIPKMGRIQMPRTLRLIIAAAGLSVAGCAALAQTKDIPSADLNEPMLYEFLLGEIALQRGDNALAAQTFLDLAKRTRDPRVA